MPPIRHWLAMSAFCVGLSCIPLDSGGGGSIPPPPINEDPPPANGGNGNGGNGNGGGSTPTVTAAYDVTVQASSLEVSGINIDATLTLMFDAESELSPSAIVDASLQDDVNNPSDTIGLAGGVFVTTEASSPLSSTSRFFELSTSGGVIRADFTQGTGDNPNRFILQRGGTVFDPSTTGVSYIVGSGSFFTVELSADGQTVRGDINLSGAPVNEPATTDTYVGSYSGRRR
jgi:hypothetical protein